MSVIDPDGVVASSESLGWQSLRALEMLNTTSEWTMPAGQRSCYHKTDLPIDDRSVATTCGVVTVLRRENYSLFRAVRRATGVMK